MKRIFLALLAVFTFNFAHAENSPKCDVQSQDHARALNDKVLGVIFSEVEQALTAKGYPLVAGSAKGRADLSFLGGLTIKASVQTVSGQTLIVDKVMSAESYTIADEWYPDGTATNPRCVLFVQALGNLVPVVNQATGKTVLEIKLKELELYKM